MVLNKKPQHRSRGLLVETLPQLAVKISPSCLKSRNKGPLILLILSPSTVNLNQGDWKIALC